MVILKKFISILIFFFLLFIFDIYFWFDFPCLFNSWKCIGQSFLIYLFNITWEKINSTPNNCTCKKCTPKQFTNNLSTEEKLYKNNKNNCRIKNPHIKRIHKKKSPQRKNTLYNFSTYKKRKIHIKNCRFYLCVFFPVCINNFCFIILWSYSSHWILNNYSSFCVEIILVVLNKLL